MNAPPNKSEGEINRQQSGSFAEILLAFLRMGCISFGGPIAHLGYFRTEFVRRRSWLTDGAYADLVALCQFLPGPASSQVSFSLGLSRGGLAGGFAAWIGFTLPSALLMGLFAAGIGWMGDASDQGWLRGLKVLAVAVVAHAVFGMAKSLCPDRVRATFAVIGAAFVLLVPLAATQVLVILIAGAAGFFLYRSDGTAPVAPLAIAVGKRTSVMAAILFAVLLIGLPVATALTANHWFGLFNAFFASGSLVFGGGHVVLPLLESQVVVTGWLTADDFLAGYGAAQALPGPLFAFAAYLGSVQSLEPNGWVGGTVALIGLFLPGLLLVLAVLPFWDQLRSRPGIQAAVRGINAAVVGILLAALYHPVFTSAILGSREFVLASAGFLMLEAWKMPPWIVVVVTVGVAAVLL